MFQLSQHGVQRFNVLKRSLGISQRMLSLTLRELERDGLVNRTYYPTIPPKVEYSLTELGISFREPIQAIAKWAYDNRTTIDAARSTYDAKVLASNHTS